MPSENGLPSVKQSLKRVLSRDTGLQLKNKGGSHVRLQPPLDKITSAKLSGASPAVIDAAILDSSTQRETEDKITKKQRNRLFAGIEDVQQQQTDPIIDDEDIPRYADKTHAVEKNVGFFGLRSASSGFKPGSANRLAYSGSQQVLRVQQSQLNLKIPKHPMEQMSQSQFDATKWQASVQNQLQRFKSIQNDVIIPKKETANTIQLLQQANSQKTFSNQHPQFLTLNCDPYTRERVTLFGQVESSDLLPSLTAKPVSKMMVSLTGEQVLQSFGPSQHLHKMKVIKPSQSGATVGSGTTPYMMSDLQQQARHQTRQLRLKMQELGKPPKSETGLLDQKGSSRFTDKFKDKGSRNSGVDKMTAPGIFAEQAAKSGIPQGQVPMTEEVLRQHYFIAKVAGKTTNKQLQKTQSPQKHILRAQEDKSEQEEDDFEGLNLNSRTIDDNQFLIAAERQKNIEKLQQQAASYMRLNSVWGLEPETNAVNIRKAEVPKELATDGGVITQCIDEDRKLSVHELGDSDLDRMILLFQSQPDDDHYFIYCDQNPDSKDPYDLRPLIEYTTKQRRNSKPQHYDKKNRPQNHDKFYTLSKKGFTLYKNDNPVEHTPLSEWLLERRFYRQIRNKDFFKNFRTWSILKMWRRNVLQKHREQIKAILQTKLFSIDETFGPILRMHRIHCKELETHRIIDLKSNNIEIATYEEFDKKQREKRKHVTNLVKEKSDMCRKYFKDGINTVLDRLRAKINESNEDEEQQKEYIQNKRSQTQQLEAKQIMNTNPTLDALGFNHSLKYGNRSKLRTACMRFLRFSYLLDFVATEALTNIYLFSVQETIKRLENLSKIPVRYEITDVKPFTTPYSIQSVETFKQKRINEVRSSLQEQPFFKVQAAINPAMLKPSTQRQNHRREKQKIVLPKNCYQTKHISEYYPNQTTVEEFNPTVHLLLEPDFIPTLQTDGTLDEDEEQSRKVQVTYISKIETHLLILEPNGEKFASLINDCLVEGMECLTVYERWSRHPDLNKYEKVLESWDNRVCEVWEQPDKLYLDCDEWLVENELHHTHEVQIKKLLSAAFSKVTQFFESYRPYLDAYWENEQIDFALLQDPRLMNAQEVISALIERFQRQKLEFEELLPDSREVGMIRVDCSAIKQMLSPQPKDNLRELQRLMPEVVKLRIEKEKKWLKEKILEIKKPALKVQDYVNQIQLLDQIDSEYQSHRDNIDQNNQIYDVLIRTDLVDSKNKAKRFIEEAFQFIRTLDSEIANARENQDKRKYEISNKIIQKIEPLNQETVEFLQELENAKYLEFTQDQEPIYKAVDVNDHTMTRLARKKNKIQEYQKTLDMKEITRFDNVEDALLKHKYRKVLWHAIRDFTNKVRIWEGMIFENINVDEIAAQSEQYQKYVIQCERNLPSESSALQFLKKLVNEFKQTMPIVKALGNKHLEQVHWDEIKALLNMSNFELEAKQFTLKELMSFNVSGMTEEVENISITATQEHNLTIAVDRIDAVWQKTEFDLDKYKERDFILTGIDKVVVILDESLSEIQDILGSRYVKRLIVKVQKLADDLLIVSDTIEAWRECQRNWLYLENIFSSKDIRQQRNKDFQDFDNVNKAWNKIMRKVSNSKKVIKNCNEKQLREFIKYNEQMDRIQKNLDQFLEEKRTDFPRFYFISSDELLQLLAEQKVVSSVEKHLNKCFDNVQKLHFGDDVKADEDSIQGVVSAEGEKIEIKPVKRTQAVEQWLKTLKSNIKSTVHHLIKQALSELNKIGDLSARQDWVLKHCGQAVNVVSKIKWTQSVEEALDEMEEDAQAMRFLFNTLQEQLQQLVDLIRTPLNSVKRKIMVSLITQEVHGRSIVEQLEQNGVDSINDFQWQQCLRYYESDQQKSVQVRQVNSVIKYGCEYMGATSRLVITPLTDRCWLTITGALHIKLGASPQGPAGTGKTESTKDLAKALGIFCVVYNCSEQVEYKMMARLFSGLIQSGAWSCLDEFNRIDVEVLSVIAQMLLDIRQAKLQAAIPKVDDETKPKMWFNDKEMQLKQNCGVFITMNPGYAGRAELPDNLKILFRPVSMMIPSYGLVAQVMLFAEGYNEAQKLSTKMVQLYKLSDEQLSQQDHYDFGMRAVKSVLVIAGNLKRLNPNVSEDVLLIRAMRDANVPKFLAQDLPLFNGIVQDLFPNVEIPEENQSKLATQIEQSTEVLNFKNLENFKRKCLQLYDTFNVRFGVMLVGPTGGGKSTCFTVLAHALSALQNDGDVAKVKVKILNPKSISMGELYGEENKDTKEWTDGLASKIMRKFVEDKKQRTTWTVFDGPVDALWIENMNTVLDDNMTLCLANGERIKLKSSMRILFEVQDLKVASPATVSRCGMVYMTPSDIGWRPYVHQWMNVFVNRRPHHEHTSFRDERILTAEQQQALRDLFDVYVEEAFTKLKPYSDQQQMKCEPVQIVKNICNFLENFLSKNNPELKKDKKEIWVRYIYAYFGFAFIWAFGGHYKPSVVRFLDNLMRENFSKCLIPTLDTVYEYYLDEKQAKFIYWKERISEFQYPQQASYFQLFVPTIDTERTQDLLKKMTSINRPVFITGGTGTGKSMIVQQFIRLNRDQMELVPIILNFSAQTTSASTQANIESKLQKKRAKVFAAKGNSKTLIFIDDVNMPAVEQYGAQPPIELMRQLIDHGGMYDRPNFFFKRIEKFSVVCAAAPPSGGRSELTPRFMRHFFIQNIPEASDEALYDIFDKILTGFLVTEQFSENIKKLSKAAVHATIDLYNQITKSLLPIPEKFHYTFNLRDIAKVFQGILMTSSISVAEQDMFAKLWLHEATRVFADRLSTPEDISFFQDLAVEILSVKFKVKWAKKDVIFAKGAQPLFSVILGLDSKKVQYELIDKKERLMNKLEEKLVDYNFSTSDKMQLVFFDDAIQHIMGILRILMQPRGNAMLIGVSGSGKQTLTKLAASIFEHEILQIKLSKNFSSQDFRDTIKEKMLPAGCDAKRTTFILNDTQIMHESFLEDVNNILNTGEITNLYSKDDYNTMETSLTKVLNKKKIPVNKENVYDEYIEQLREHFHIILCMSPVGDMLRNRCRKFPSLVNCCTLDWFFTWPEEALYGVAEQYLKDIDTSIVPSKDKKTLAQLFPSVHRSVEDAADQFALELRRKTYVTPKSYLDGINLYIQHLKHVVLQHETMKSRYKNGVYKLKQTKKQIDDLQHKLKELIPKLDVQRKECEAKEIEIKKNEEIALKKELETETEAATVRMDAKEIARLKNEAENELNNAKPQLEAANKAVDALDKNDVADLKQTKNPTSQTEVALKCVLTYLGFSKPDWQAAQKCMADINFLKNLKQYDKDKIDPKIIEKVKKIVLDKVNFNVEKIMLSNRAAGGLAKWCLAVYRYSETLKKVQPIQAAVENLQDKHQKAEKEVEKKQAEVDEVKAKLRAMQDDLAQTQQYIQNLTLEKEKCERRQINAVKLIDLLTDEGKRWEENIVMLEEEEQFFAGNVFIAVSSLSYLGPFNGQFRERLVIQWREMVGQRQLEISPNYSLKQTLGDPVQIRNWNLAGLPQDDVSIENAILAAKTSRWPLMIDPESQANKWIKKMFNNPDNILAKDEFSKSNFGGSDFVVIRNNDDSGQKSGKSYQKMIESAIIRGQTVLLEDVGADLDPSLDSILTKAVRKIDGVEKITFGDKVLIYDQAFRFMMTTKLPNPHFMPETCIKTTIINFSVTFKGLEDQLLADVINNLQPDLEFRRDKLVVEIAQKKNDLYQKQSQILKELADSNGETILDNEVLIETLEVVKSKSITTLQDLNEALKVEAKIEETRDMHREVAIRGSILYFAIVDMSFVNEMYQNSLQYVKKLFNEAIEKVDFLGETARLNHLLKESITRDLYKKICIGLFEAHKIVYAFLICTSIKRRENVILDAYWNLLIRGSLLSNKQNQPLKPFRLLSFVSDAQWDIICSLQKISEDQRSKFMPPGLYKQTSQHSEADFSSRAKSLASNLPSFQKVKTTMSRKESRESIVSGTNKMVQNQTQELEPGISINILDDPLDARQNRSKSPTESKKMKMSRKDDMSGRNHKNSDSVAGSSVKNQKSIAGCHFSKLCKELEDYADDWEAYSVGREPFDRYFDVMPCNYGKRLNAFEKLLLIKLFRPEKVAESISTYLEQEIGPEFASNPVSSIENLFMASDCGTPIIFVLSQGVDPTFQLIDFAKKYGEGNQELRTMSLGQGQERAANRLIDEGMRDGHWVMLQNCHLFKSWMPVLAQKVNMIQEAIESPDTQREGFVPVHQDFRLILTSMPVDYFPVIVLQTGLKMTTEPPQGIKNNLQRTYMNIVTQEVYDQLNYHFESDKSQFYSLNESEKASVNLRASSAIEKATEKSMKHSEMFSRNLIDVEELKQKNNQWRSLLFGLSFFHAVIQERRKFGPLGWNIFYEFSDADLVTSITMIKNFLLENDEIPWDAMKFMTGQINYGGRVTDDFDRQLLMTILQIFQNDDLVSQENYKFSSSGHYFCPEHRTVSEIKDYIYGLPNIDLPEIFGMHENANIAFLKNESLKILEHVLNVQPRQSKASAGVSNDTLVLEQVKLLSAQVPELIDTEAYHKEITKTNAQGLLHCFSTVLMQEVYKYNTLLVQINQTLSDLQQAVKGIILMSPSLDLMFSSLLKNQVPQNWQQVSYPSLKPLGSWIDDLNERIRFMRNWAKYGHPKAYWLSGFFFPHGFITGILQTYARKYFRPIDLLSLKFKMQDIYEASAVKQAPAEGVYIYGLFMENASWSIEQQCLVDAALGEMNCQMPIIHFQPVYKGPVARQTKKDQQVEDEDEGEYYKCPVYKTNQRAGVLSTTGKSTNFILTVDLPCTPIQDSESNDERQALSQGLRDSAFMSNNLVQKNTPEYWMLRGAALISMLNE